MNQPARTTRTVSRRDILEQIDELLRQVSNGETQISVEDEGETVAAIISGSDLARLRRYDSQIAAGEAVLERMRRPYRDIDPEQIERDVALVIEEVRREQRDQEAGPDKQ